MSAHCVARALLPLVLLAAPQLPAQGTTSAAPTNANIEVLRTVYGAFGRGDIPTVLELLDENTVWTVPAGLYYGGEYRGREAVLNGIFMRLANEWDGFQVRPAVFAAEGEHVFVRGEYSGTNKATGQQLRAPFVHVYRVQNGKITEYQGYTDTALFNRTAGR